MKYLCWVKIQWYFKKSEINLKIKYINYKRTEKINALTKEVIARGVKKVPLVVKV
jgi:hypothetical protein